VTVDLDERIAQHHAFVTHAQAATAVVESMKPPRRARVLGYWHVASMLLLVQLALVVLQLALVANPVHAQPARQTGPQTALVEQLRALIAKAALSERVGLSIVDIASGQTLLAHNARAGLNPASNLKLLTAATAMLELGPEFRMRTGLYGRIRDGVIEGGVCVKGQADPTLTRADFVLFAQRLADEGVREVDEVVIDGTYFDAATLPPAFEQQPNEVAPFRAAIAGVSVNANAYTLRVRPGASEGAAAFASVDGSGYFDVDNGLITTPEATPNVIAAERVVGDRIALSLRGALPLGAASLAYERRVTSPLHYAGYVFIDALTALRIKAPKRVLTTACPIDAPLIATHVSPALAEILARLGKDSDNFVAEMVLKTLGAERRHKPGSSSDGVSVVQETLKRQGLPTEGLSMVNGSGLFQGNRVSTELISQLLVVMYKNPSLRDDFVAHLAVGGVDGTLARRFRNLPAARIVRAKTGTLDDVIALSGYVLGPSADRAVAFSYLANGVSGKHGQARDLIDRVIETIAAHLYGRPAPTP
jgi:D-alanyl-D-alanine carboxypeptidase/D-alanyl-D-alanine-endopeptidase (penicillin-binding protein 4)